MCSTLTSACYQSLIYLEDFSKYFNKLSKNVPSFPEKLKKVTDNANKFLYETNDLAGEYVYKHCPDYCTKQFYEDLKSLAPDVEGVDSDYKVLRDIVYRDIQGVIFNMSYVPIEDMDEFFTPLIEEVARWEIVSVFAMDEAI